MRKMLKITAIAVGSLLLLCVLAGWFMTTEPGEDVLRGWLESQITAEAGLPVSIGRLETNLWSRVQLDTIVVMPLDGSDTVPTLFVGRLNVEYSVSDLLGRPIRLRAIEIDSVVVALEFDSLGRSGIPLLDNPIQDVEGSGESAPLIMIDSVSLSRIGARYRDVQLPLLAEATGVQASASGGADGSYTGHVSVSSCAVTYDSLILAIEDIEVAATMHDEILQLDYAQADCEGLTIEVSGDINLAEPRSLALIAGVEGSIASIGSVVDSAYGDFPITSGFIKVDLVLQGSFDNPHVLFDGSFRDLVSPSLTVDSAWVSAEYKDNKIDLSALHLETLGGTIAARGSAGLDTLGANQIEMNLNGLALSEIWQAVHSEDSPYRGRLFGTITAAGATGDWRLWVADAALRGENLRYNGRPVPDLTCTANVDSSRATLSLVHGTDEIYADLTLSADGVSGECTVSVPDLTALARLIDQPELAGTVHIHGTVDGSFDNPVLSASVTGSRISYRDFPLDSLIAELSYSDSRLTVLNLACWGELDSVDTEHPPFGLDSINGSLAYECELSGPLDELKGRLSAGMVAPEYAQYSLDSIAVEVLFHGSRIDVTHLDANLDDLNARFTAAFDTTTKVGSFEMMLRPIGDIIDAEIETVPELTSARDLFGAVEGHFSLEPDSQFKANIHGDRLWLGLIPRLLSDTLQVKGDASFDLTLDGPYFAPDAILNARIQSLEIADQRVDSIVACLRLDSQALTLDSLNSYALGQTLRASGRLALSIADNGYYEISANGELEADLSTTDFDLAVFKDLLLPDGEIAGKVSAALQISGPTSSPTFDGWLTLSEGAVVLDKDSPPLDSIVMSLSFVDTLLTLHSATTTISHIPISVSGSLATSRFESASADLEMSVGQFGRVKISGSFSEEALQVDLISDTINLVVLEPFMPAIDSLAGRLNANIRVGGELASPELDGEINLKGAAFHSPRHNVRVTDGCADVRLDLKRAFVDSVTATLNGGSVFLTGVVSHDQGELMDVGFEARASNVRLEEPGTYTVMIDSAAMSYGRLNESYVLDGDLLLGECRFIAGLRPTAVLPWVQSIETVDMELPDLIARSRLDVRIRESDNLWVDNNLARIRLRAELGVIGTPLRPNFTGLVRIEEGYLIYLDRRFKVNEGTVYFTDPNRFNPDIKLDARTQVTIYRRATAEPYTIYIQAEGYLDQLRYGLFSEPALDRPDIVALLTLGATRSELTKSGDNGGGGGLSQVLKDRAAMLTSQRVSGYVSRKAGAVFGFDEFSIQGNLFQFDNSWGPQLVASKRLSQRVDLTYSTTVGHLNDQSVRLGYRLTSRWSLMGETDRQGRSGLDLKFGFTFK